MLCFACQHLAFYSQRKLPARASLGVHSGSAGQSAVLWLQDEQDGFLIPHRHQRRPVKPVDKAPEKVVETAPVADAKPKGPDPEKVALCLATANTKRAKFSGEPPQVTVKHILVKYSGAKNADAAITRTREEACLRAIEARDKLVGGADFDDVVKEFSEEPGAASRNGSIGSGYRR